VPSLQIGNLGGPFAGLQPASAHGELVPKPNSAATTDPPAARRLDELRRAPVGRVLSVESVGPSVRILRVVRPPGFRFRPGQYVKLGVPGCRTRHSYSIASAPHEPHLEFCIESVSGGRLSPQLCSLLPGQRVEVGDRARGELAADVSKLRQVLVATVTGIAPLRSLWRHALAHAPQRHELLIVHGASYADELAYATELKQLAASRPNVTYVPTISRPGASRNRLWTGQIGRADEHAARLTPAFGAPDSVQVLACGHPGMIDAVRAALRPRGFEIQSESFR
jgi:ferredoxin-NADP reductase